ncbi:YdbC family protein [Peptoniphilus asaccharolyticus]
MAEFKFEITKYVATLSTKSNGWTKELNMVSWNDRAPKYDIREWDPDHVKMSKGITFDEAEFEELVEAIKSI